MVKIHNVVRVALSTIGARPVFGFQEGGPQLLPMLQGPGEKLFSVFPIVFPLVFLKARLAIALPPSLGPAAKLIDRFHHPAMSASPNQGLIHAALTSW